MVSKKVLQKIGVYAMAAVVAAAPIVGLVCQDSLLVSASGGGGTGNRVEQPAEKPAEAPAVNNSAVTTASGQVLNSSVAGVYTVTAVDGLAVVTPAADCTSAFGSDAVEMLAQNSDHGPKAEASLQHGMAQLESDGVAATKGPVVDLLAYVAGGKVNDIAAPITVSMGVPADFQTAGYDYAVIRVQEGGRVSVLTDSNPDPAILTFATDGFGVFSMLKAPSGSFDKYK